MSMLSRLRGARHPTPRADTEPERFAFSAELPAGRFGSICKFNLEVLVEPQRDGERLRLRAHMQTNLASVLRPALTREAASDAAHSAPPSSLRAVVPAAAMQATRAAGRGLQRVLTSRTVTRLTEPLLRRDFNTWLEVQASTEPLHNGASSLVPQRERLAELGIHPSKGRGPQADSWSGYTATGFAQLSLLQIDKSDLPPDLARRLGAQPFHLAAAIVNTADRK